ncbi:ATP-dependent helicase [Clostridium sp. ZBS18]|uniref:ATP-dependent helicase n=1 Tax=Clostridium sp. ZBS18 TaxID=2949967 RepID=UPI00207AA51A|nr:ATP-dependent helicase [Clostridium sp. ZBS18]
MVKIKYDKKQEEVINHKEGVAIVIAGAGSGKSTTLVGRVQNLIKNGVSESNISVTSFSNDSATDLKNKLQKLGIKKATMGTFHSMCEKILIKEGIDTINNKVSFQVDNILNNAYKKINYENKSLTKGQLKDIKGFIGYQKNNMITYEDSFLEKDSKFSEYELRIFFKAYEEGKRKLGLYDWDDELIECYKILLKNPDKYTYEYILVDEAQDNNLVQNKLIKLLCPSKNIMVIGDYRQAIYKFRGADPSLFMNFNKEFSNAKIINLDYNYRSAKNIVNNANNFIKKYYGDYEFYSDSIANKKNDGKIDNIVSYDKQEEAINIVNRVEDALNKGVKPNDIAVLYRNNSNSFEIEKELKNRNISYFINSEDGNFFNRKEINCIMNMLKLIENPHDNSAFKTILETRTFPVTYIKKDVHNDIEYKSASSNSNMSYYEASENIRTERPKDSENLRKLREIIYDLILQHKNGIKLNKLIDNIIRLLKINTYIDTNYEGEEIEERLESLMVLKSFVRDNTLESFLKFVYGSNKSKKKCTKDDIQLMTIHKSKGLEFKNVYLIGIQDGKFPSEKAPIDEEARLMYVAITRPKENLTLSQIYDGNKFIEEYLN